MQIMARTHTCERTHIHTCTHTYLTSYVKTRKIEIFLLFEMKSLPVHYKISSNTSFQCLFVVRNCVDNCLNWFKML